MTCCSPWGKKKPRWGVAVLFALRALSAAKLSCTVQTDSPASKHLCRQGELRQAGERTRSRVLPASISTATPTALAQSWARHAQRRAVQPLGARSLPLLLAYICYLLLGATIFQLLEKQAESPVRGPVPV